MVESDLEKIKILNTEIVAATQEELLGNLQQGVVVTPNIDHLVKLQQDGELYALYKQTEWVVCDSRLLYLFMKLLPKSLPQAIPGSSFFPAFYMYHKNDENCHSICIIRMMRTVAYSCWGAWAMLPNVRWRISTRKWEDG